MAADLCPDKLVQFTEFIIGREKCFPLKSVCRYKRRRKNKTKAYVNVRKKKPLNRYVITTLRDDDRVISGLFFFTLCLPVVSNTHWTWACSSWLTKPYNISSYTQQGLNARWWIETTSLVLVWLNRVARNCRPEVKKNSTQCWFSYLIKDLQTHTINDKSHSKFFEMHRYMKSQEPKREGLILWIVVYLLTDYQKSLKTVSGTALRKNRKSCFSVIF